MAWIQMVNSRWVPEMLHKFTVITDSHLLGEACTSLQGQ